MLGDNDSIFIDCRPSRVINGVEPSEQIRRFESNRDRQIDAPIQSRIDFFKICLLTDPFPLTRAKSKSFQGLLLSWTEDQDDVNEKQDQVHGPFENSGARAGKSERAQ